MNWNRIEGSWKQFKGSAKARWGALTEDRLGVVAGKRDQLAGRIQEDRGARQEAAESRMAGNQESSSAKKKDPRDLQ